MKRLAIAVALTAACSSNTPSGGEAAARHSLRPILERASFVAAHARAAAPLREIDGGYRPIAAERPALDVLLPKSARGRMTLTPHDRSNTSISIAAADVDDVKFAREGSLAVARRARVATDLVVMASGEFVEESRVLHSAAAAPNARWRIDASTEIASMRVRDGRIEALDAAGVLVVGSSPVVAFDARGVERALSVHITREGASFVVDAELDVEGLAYPIVIDPAWSTVGSPLQRPVDASLTLLASGKVLRAGGYAAGPLKTAEIYDPTTNTWSSAAPLANERSRHGAVRLSSGKVLVIGGSDATTGVSTTELYDPASNSWSALAPAPTALGGAPSLLMSNGKVLNGSAVASQIYDPASNTWTTVSSTASAAFSPLIELPSGNVLATGGMWGSVSRSAASVFNPMTNTWTDIAPMSASRYGHGALLLPSGKVLVAGGMLVNSVDGYVPRSTAELYDPVAGSWSSAASMGSTRSFVNVVPLNNGRIFAISDQQSTAELYDPTANTWLPVSPPASGSLVYAPTSVRLGDGSVLTMTQFSVLRFQPMANGSACSATVAAECASGQCVDGVCCSTSCTATCSACDVSGSVGTCSAVTGPAHGSRSCSGGFACNAGSCRTSCSADTHCAPDRYCSGTSCVVKKVAGATCSRAGECATGFCADGVCCNAACTGQCEACDVFGSSGTCTAVTGAPRGGRPACTGAGVGTECGHQCNGVNRTACAYPGATVTCSKNECKDGVETHATTCNGSGACSDVPKSCGAFACATTTCKTTCAADTDCASGFYCAAGVCTAVAGLGEACTSSSTCSGGLFCTDGVCCGVANCGAGRSCATTTKKGQCAKVVGSSCTANAECGSGHCVDGACCDTACDGQCEACDVTGKVGTCTPIAGEPHGGRTKCGDGGGDPCRARTCDGAKDAKTCAGYAGGPTTTCAAASCSGASLVAESKCDGNGACVAPAAISCAPYACTTTGCLTSCVAPADCAPGFECRGSSCVSPPRATCEPDGVSSRDTEGKVTSCIPYICGTDGSCTSACGTTADCASGYVCDSASKTCVSTGGTSDDGGCAMGRSGGTATLSFIALLGAALLARRDRARRAAGRTSRGR